MQGTSGRPFPKPVQTALEQFWEQLDVFADVLVTFRGHNYAQRL